MDGPHRMQIREQLKMMEGQIKLALEEFDYQILDQAMVQMPLPFKTKIHTIYQEHRPIK